MPVTDTRGAASKRQHRRRLTMTVAAAQLFVLTVAIYIGVGAGFATIFLWRWVGRLDPAAARGTWGFRMLVFPGVAALWPMFVARLVQR
jgi:hypothetical protein